MVKLTDLNTIDLSEEMAATGYPGPYNVKTTTTGGKSGTEIIYIEVSPAAHPDVVIHTQITMRDLINQRIDIDYITLSRGGAGDYDGDRLVLPSKRTNASWKRDFYTPPKKPVLTNAHIQRLLNRLGGNLEPT